MKNVFVFKPSVFIFQDEEKTLFYNSSSSAIFEWNNNLITNRMAKEASKPGSLYRTAVSGEELEKNAPLFENLEKLGFGKLFPVGDAPLSYPPRLLIDTDAERIKWRSERGEGGFILSNLREVSLYLSGDIEARCFAKQTLCPLKKNNSQLDIQQLEPYIRQLYYSPISRINFLASSKSDIPLMLDIVSSFPENWALRIYCYLDDWTDEELSALRCVFKNIDIVLVCRPSSFRKSFADMSYHFLVEGEEDHELALSKDVDYRLIPIYNGHNRSFFQKYIYTRREDLCNLSKRDIFIHQTLNQHFFGKIAIFPDGTISPGLQYPAVGTIKDALFDIIYSLLSENSPWMLTRSKTKCKTCRYNNLCPSPSIYEQTIRDEKLCFLSK